MAIAINNTDFKSHMLMVFVASITIAFFGIIGILSATAAAGSDNNVIDNYLIGTSVSYC